MTSKTALLSFLLSVAFASASSAQPLEFACDCDGVTAFDARGGRLGDSIVVTVVTDSTVAPGVAYVSDDGYRATVPHPSPGAPVVRVAFGDSLSRSRRVVCDRDPACAAATFVAVGRYIYYAGEDSGPITLYIGESAYSLGDYDATKYRVRFRVPNRVPRPSGGVIETPSGAFVITLPDLAN